MVELQNPSHAEELSGVELLRDRTGLVQVFVGYLGREDSSMYLRAVLSRNPDLQSFCPLAPRPSCPPLPYPSAFVSSLSFHTIPLLPVLSILFGFFWCFQLFFLFFVFIFFFVLSFFFSILFICFPPPLRQVMMYHDEHSMLKWSRHCICILVVHAIENGGWKVFSKLCSICCVGNLVCSIHVCLLLIPDQYVHIFLFLLLRHL